MPCQTFFRSGIESRRPMLTVGAPVTSSMISQRAPGCGNPPAPQGPASSMRVAWNNYEDGVAVAEDDSVAAVPSSVLPAPLGDFALGVPGPGSDNVLADPVGALVEDVVGTED